MRKAEVDARVKAERLYRQVESEKQCAEASLENVSKARKETYKNSYATRMRLAGDAAASRWISGCVQTFATLSPQRSNEDDIRNWEWYYLAAVPCIDCAALMLHQASALIHITHCGHGAPYGHYPFISRVVECRRVSGVCNAYLAP